MGGYEDIGEEDDWTADPEAETENKLTGKRAGDKDDASRGSRIIETKLNLDLCMLHGYFVQIHLIKEIAYGLRLELCPTALSWRHFVGKKRKPENRNRLERMFAKHSGNVIYSKGTSPLAIIISSVEAMSKLLLHGDKLPSLFTQVVCGKENLQRVVRGVL